MSMQSISFVAERICVNLSMDYAQLLNILVARNRKSGNLEIGVPVLGNRLFCAWLLVHFYGDISQGLAASAVRSSLY